MGRKRKAIRRNCKTCGAEFGPWSVGTIYCSPECRWAALRTPPIAVQLATNMVPGLDDECWPWRGTHSSGYGTVWFEGHNYLVHRLVYESVHGAIPKGRMVIHLCKPMSDCCNPRHIALREGTKRKRSA